MIISTASQSKKNTNKSFKDSNAFDATNIFILPEIESKKKIVRIITCLKFILVHLNVVSLHYRLKETDLI